jgi:hypothetical protein
LNLRKEDKINTKDKTHGLKASFVQSKNSVVAAIIASTIRNEDTYQQFLQQLKQHLLSYKVLDPVSNKIFHYDRSLKYSIIKIFK